MGKPYSDDLRGRVVAAIEAGHTRVKVAERYNMALSTVGGFIKRKRETGSISPDKFGGYKTFTLEPHTDRVKELVAEQPDSTLAELQDRVAKEKVKVSPSGISRFLHHINLTFKKKGLLQIEWVKWGGFSRVDGDFKGFLVNLTVTSWRHVCPHAKIDQDEAPER